jgi:predicted ATPase
VREPQTVAQHLQQKQVLLVLDNLEQLLGAAASLAVLLHHSPGTKLLVTSRAPLHLSGEHEFLVPPLADEEAVKLFAERARAIQPSFEADEHVSEICRRLDNLPLALELAAARARLLSPQALLQRLGERLPVLTGGPLDAPERQRTLRAAIEWSYDLLTPEEQGLFVRLAVFAGGFALRAAEEVSAADLDTLQSLVEQSLLREAGEDRFSMLETVREYALERFGETGEAEDLRRRHADHYARLAGEIDRLIHSPQQYRLLKQLELEDGNTRAALDWLLAADPVRALELALHLGVFWAQRDRLRESIHWLHEAVHRIGKAKPALQAQALRLAGEAEWILGNEEQATALFNEGLVLAQQAGEKREIAGALLRLGRGEEGLELYREVGDQQGLARALVVLGDQVCEEGDLGRARELIEESVQILRGLGNPWSLAGAVHSLGDCALLEGRLEEARECFREGLRLGLDLQTEYVVVYFLGGFAALESKRGDRERAVRLWGAVQALEDSRGYRLMQPHRSRYERLLDPLVEGPELSPAFREGFEGGTDAAVELALSPN